MSGLLIDKSTLTDICVNLYVRLMLNETKLKYSIYILRIHFVIYAYFTNGKYKILNREYDVFKYREKILKLEYC